MVQKRSIATCLVLSIVTCGIYGIYWFICMTDDTNAVAGIEGGTTGGMAFLYTLITCGIYQLYWLYKQGEKLDTAKAQQGLPSGSSGVLYLVLGLLGFGIISMALMQDSINKLAE